MPNSTNWTSSAVNTSNWAPTNPNSTTFGPQTNLLYDDSTRAYDTTITTFGSAVDYYEGALPIIGGSTNWTNL